MEATASTPQSPAHENALVYTTRFGDVHLREDRLISFEQGLLGFADCKTFGLSQLPNADESPLLLLQCVEDPNVSFLVGDPNVLGIDIAKTDREKALKDTQMNAADTQFLVILTLYEQEDSYYLTANVRAPLLVDSAERTGCQHILANKAYTTQHKI